MRASECQFTTPVMPMLVAGLLLLWLSSVLLRGFTRANPAAMARMVRQGGGMVALLLAALLILRGEFNIALLAAGLGLWLVGGRSGSLARAFRPNVRGFAGRARVWPSDPVRVRTDGLDVTIDRAAGTMRGGFTAGPYAGRELDTLSEVECAMCYRWCLAADPQGARMLEGYLDGRFAGWRQASDFRDDLGSAQSGGRARRPMSMADHEAYHVLGLAEGASREEITRAHRRLMKQHHPDHGGSAAMAARVNEAKDVLMRRHP